MVGALPRTPQIVIVVKEPPDVLKVNLSAEALQPQYIHRSTSLPKSKAHLPHSNAALTLM